MMPMMLAQEASIIDIIGVPFLLPKPSGAVLVFEAVLAGAPRRACVQNGACKDAHDALTEGGLESSKTLPVLGFPFGTLARCAAPRRPGEKRRSHEARSAALCPSGRGGLGGDGCGVGEGCGGWGAVWVGVAGVGRCGWGQGVDGQLGMHWSP